MNVESKWENVSNWVQRWATIQPHKQAIIFNGRVLTWKDFDALVDQFAHLMISQGVKRGDRVGCLMHNNPEFIATFFAATRLGAIFVPYNVHYTGPELSHALDDSGPAVVVTESAFKDVLESLSHSEVAIWISVDGGLPFDSVPFVANETMARVGVEPLDSTTPAAILYTSGTTGKPKGAVLTHGNISAMTLVWNLDLSLDRDERHIVFLPLCFTGGIMGSIMNPVHAGATIILHESFDAERILKSIEDERGTWMAGVPFTFNQMLSSPSFEVADLSSMRRAMVGAAPADKKVMSRFIERGIGIVHAFGMTEASGGGNLTLGLEDSIRKLGSMGFGTSYTAVRVMVDEAEAEANEVGEMQFSGPLVFPGYWNNPEATAEAFTEDGWLRTGDLVYRDDEGYHFTAGRRTDMIVSGGLNVYSAEVESVLSMHPDIGEIAVTGLPDDRWQEVVVAFVIPRDGMNPTIESVREFAKGKLASYKIPKRIILRAELPRTVSGKVQKFQLRQQSE